ncbi:hypothetical protein KM043_007083 [Ampulex compressa]|nr:hypothetical protein KM043_007083 [Ampulex compressa]
MTAVLGDGLGGGGREGETGPTVGSRGEAGKNDGCGVSRERPRRGGKKRRSDGLLPAHERTKETIVEFEVEYKLS